MQYHEAVQLLNNCNICNDLSPTNIVPDRTVGVWRFYSLCTICIDEFLSVYRGIFFSVKRREVSGVLRNH